MTGREGVHITPGHPVTVAASLPTEPAMPPSRPAFPYPAFPHPPQGPTPPPPGWVVLRLPSTVKSLRETLAIAQTEICNADAEYGHHAWQLQELIDQLDVLRPLGPDGVHGDRHTPWCGCEL